jgi:rod shape-determining protein MreC
MALLEIRRRTGWLFVLIVLAHIILISAQAKTRRGIPVLDTVVFGIFAEINRVVTSAVGGAKDTWQNYVDLQDVRQENETLEAQVAQLRIALQQERTLAEESRGLQDLLQLKRDVALDTTAARVIGGSATSDFRTLTIDKGTDHGLGPDMAVIVPQGVVGRIVQVTARAAKVQLLIDADAAAGALVERSRARGVVVGTSSGLRLDYVVGSADVEVGDRVVTSGIEGIYPSSVDGKYPRGFVIGHIESLRRGSAQFENVTVRPAVDFSSLETVLVVLTRPPDGAIETAVRDDGPAAARDADR